MTMGGLRPNANLHATVYVWIASSRVGTRMRQSGEAVATPRSRLFSTPCARSATTKSDIIGIRYAASTHKEQYTARRETKLQKTLNRDRIQLKYLKRSPFNKNFALKF